MSLPIYRGFSTVNATNMNTKLTNMELVKIDIANVFNTKLGERVNRPDHGSIIHDLLFDVFDERTETLCYNDANRILNDDPRVKIMSLTVDVDDAQHSITIRALLKFVEFNMDDYLILKFQSN